MDNGKLENKFAMHLSGILKGKNFNQGIKLISKLPCAEYSSPMCEPSDLDSAYGYKFRGECQVMLDGMDEYGIAYIYFKINVNATHEEMVDLLEDYGEYDSEDDENWDEDEIIRAFWREFDRICYDLEYDELEERFADMCTYWDILIDEDLHYYRGGEQEVYQY